MRPILFELGPLVVMTSSVFTWLSFLTTAFVFWRKTREEHYQQEQVFDAFLLATMFGLIVGRLGHIALNWSDFGLNLWNWLDIVGHAGNSLLIGLIGAGWYLFRYSGKQKWDQFEVLDFWSLAVAAGLVLRQVGDFFAGAGFGKETNLPWGMIFPTVFTKHHPTQLYTAILLLGLYLYLSWAEYNYRTFIWYRSGKKTAQTGFLTAVFLIGAGLSMTLVQFFKPAQLTWQYFNFDLIFYLLMAVWGGGLLWIKSGRSLKFGKKAR